jgi:hypothetical protein
MLSVLQCLCGLIKTKTKQFGYCDQNSVNKVAGAKLVNLKAFKFFLLQKNCGQAVNYKMA